MPSFDQRNKIPTIYESLTHTYQVGTSKLMDRACASCNQNKAHDYLLKIKRSVFPGVKEVATGVHAKPNMSVTAFEAAQNASGKRCEPNLHYALTTGGQLGAATVLIAGSVYAYRHRQQIKEGAGKAVRAAKNLVSKNTTKPSEPIKSKL